MRLADLPKVCTRSARGERHEVALIVRRADLAHRAYEGGRNGTNGLLGLKFFVLTTGATTTGQVNVSSTGGRERVRQKNGEASEDKGE